jgi:hypothetical protein
MTSGPVPLAAALNAALGLRLADPAEARAWLAAGGFEQLDTWIQTHRADPEEDMTDVPDLPEWITT